MVWMDLYGRRSTVTNDFHGGLRSFDLDAEILLVRGGGTYF